MIGIVVFASGLVAAIVAALRLGAPARLDPKQAIDVLGKALRASGIRLLLLAAIVLVLAYTFDVSARLAWLGFLLWMLAFALHTFRRRGATLLVNVAQVCVWFLIAFAYGLNIGSHEMGSVWILVPVAALLAPFAGRRRRRFRAWYAVAGIAASAAVALLVWPAIPDRADARAFAETYDAENPRWDLWARIAQRTGGDFSRQAARIHAVLDAGEDLSAFTLVEFARLGLLRDKDYEPYLRRSAMLLLRRLKRIDVFGELTIRGLLARGRLRSERPRDLAEREASALPAAPDRRALTDWRNGLFALEALDARDLAGKNAAALPKILAAHWTGTAGSRPFAAAFDYTPYPEEPDDGPRYVAATADAVALMVEFGAPEDIDKERLAFYLASVARESSTYRQTHRMLASLALEEFEASFDLGVLHRIRGRPLLWIASLCAVAVALLAVSACRR